MQTDYYISRFWEIVTIEFLLIFALGYYLLLWIILFFWVGSDIKTRTKNIFYRIFCQFLQILPPPFWLLLYVIIRPWKNRFHIFQEEVDEQLEGLKKYIEQKNSEDLKNHFDDDKFRCHNCECEIEEGFIVCPSCLVNLKHACKKCEREIRSSWEVCPYCATRQKEMFHVGKEK